MLNGAAHTELPTGELNNKPAEDFAEIVHESKEKLNFNKMEPPKIKRGPGRPRKIHVAPNPGEPAASAATEVVGPQIVDIAKYLEAPIQAISQFPAAKYKIPELALSADEAKMCALSLNECIQAFVPDVNKMDPKTAAVLGVFLTFGSIGMTKYAIYAEKRSIPPVVEVQTKNAEIPKQNPNEYFATQRH